MRAFLTLYLGRCGVSVFLTVLLSLTTTFAYAQSNEYFYIVHKPTGLKLSSCSVQNGDPVLVVNNNDSSRCSHWYRVPKSDGKHFYIVSRHSDKHIRPETKTNGSEIVLRPRSWRGSWTQWRYNEREDGFGHLVNRQTGKHLHTPENGEDTEVRLRPSYWRGDFTQWAFVPVPPMDPNAVPLQVSAQKIELDEESACGAGVANTFSEVSELIGLSYVHSTEDNMFQQSGGVAAGDFDNDNWVDLYAVGGSNAPSVLLKNQGDGSFVDVAADLGVDFQERNSGPAFADINGDGYLDLFVGAVGGVEISDRNAENRLLINMAGEGFADVAADAGVFVNGNTVSASFADYDYDDDLDIFMTHWIRGVQWRDHQHLWQNNDGIFNDVTQDVGIRIRAVFSPSSDSSFASTFTDINGDNLIDILVASDSLGSQSFENNGDGSFTETTNGDNVFSQFNDQSGMGSAVGDYDNDGDMDWFVSAIDQIIGVDPQFHGNRLYENDGTGLFTDVTEAAGVREGYWGWGACFADFNNDGLLDIFHVNGMYPVEEDQNFDWDRYDDDPSRLFINNGDKSFTEMSADMGIVNRKQGRGVSCLDYDRDGDMDIMVANNGQSPDFFCNHGNNNHSVNVRLRQPGKNAFGIGAKIYVTADEVQQIREIRTGNNFVSQNPSEAHFGLGSATHIDEIKVIWPDGKESVLLNLDADKHYIITRTDS